MYSPWSSSLYVCIKPSPCGKAALHWTLQTELTPKISSVSPNHRREHDLHMRPSALPAWRTLVLLRLSECLVICGSIRRACNDITWQHSSVLHHRATPAASSDTAAAERSALTPDAGKSTGIQVRADVCRTPFRAILRAPWCHWPISRGMLKRSHYYRFRI